PDRWALAVLVPRAFDLVGRGGRAPEEALGEFARGRCHEAASSSPGQPPVATERNARSSPLMMRVVPVTVNVALDRMSLELLPTLTSTGPGSITRSPETPV